MIRTCGLLALAGLCVGATAARAEKVEMTADELKATATHVVKGDVVAIYQRTATDMEWKYTHYVAEVRVGATEKGDGLKAGDLVYVRYWHRAWVGDGLPPPSTSGHRGLPAVGEGAPRLPVEERLRRVRRQQGRRVQRDRSERFRETQGRTPEVTPGRAHGTAFA